MRNEKRRDRWSDESEYIVNLTKQLVSKNSLDFIAEDARHGGQLNPVNPNNQPHYQYHPYDPVWPYYY